MNLWLGLGWPLGSLGGGWSGRQLTLVQIIVPDLVLLEVLRGARDETLASRIERNLSKFEIVQLGGKRLAVAAARHYRDLRRLGIKTRGSINLIIGAFCIEHGATLLHHDRADFVPMQNHLGLICL